MHRLNILVSVRIIYNGYFPATLDRTYQKPKEIDHKPYEEKPPSNGTALILLSVVYEKRAKVFVLKIQ